MIKKLAFFSFGIAFILALTIAISDYLISEKSELCYSNVNKIPHKKVGLLLGTSKYLSRGVVNKYYSYRIDAALNLYRHHKVDFLLVSGDNSDKRYNEPETFKRDLVKAGVPESKIFLDYAGFRTLDSVERCKAVFSQDDVTIISQQFHNERALFIADKKGLNAIGFNAKDVSFGFGFKTQIREKLARVKTVLDLTILGTKPKFYGEKIVIE